MTVGVTVGVTVKEKSGAKAAAGKTFKTTYYTLVIGNHDSRSLPRLNTAVNDAKEVNGVLTEKYGFRTELLLNAMRKDILSTTNDFHRS